MTLLASEVINAFYTFLWPMIRISALLMTAPVISINAINIRLRILIAFALAVMIYPLHEWPTIDPISSSGLFEIFNQIFIGAIMGLMLQVVTAAIVVAGQSIAAAMGLGMANMIDPNVGNVPVISSFLLILSSLIFIGFGGHVVLLGLLLDSFTVIPIGMTFASTVTLGNLVSWSAMMFLGAVLLALPLMVTMLFINIGVGVITRAAPSLNIFAVGFPAFIFAGFVLLIVTMAIIGNRIEWLWIQAFVRLRNLLGLG